jgi:hypothetical protein
VSEFLFSDHEIEIDRSAESEADRSIESKNQMNTWIPGEAALLLLGRRRERVRRDAGLVAGGGGQVGHVLLGGQLLNCCQILEHHLLHTNTMNL